MKQILSCFAVLVVVAGSILLKQYSVISETLAAAFIGAIVPLAGVLWTLNFSQKQFYQTLVEERHKKTEERAFTAKQGAFIVAAEAMTRFTNYLISLPDRQTAPCGRC
jgi:hypothetical protein